MFVTADGIVQKTAIIILSLRKSTQLIPMSNLLARITVNPKQCGGRPCIRGMRIRVSDVLDLFAAGLSAEQILEEMPDLEMDDLKASLLYAARKLDHPVLAILVLTILLIDGHKLVRVIIYSITPCLSRRLYSRRISPSLRLRIRALALLYL
jgi:uncharacterized protein (DUF433 family)